MFNTKGLNGESYLDYFSTEKSLYYLTDCNLRQYDLQNSKVINCSNKIYKTCDVSDYRYAKFLSASSDGNDILICSNKGVIKYSQNTNKKSMIINGRNTSFGLEDMHLLSFEKIDSNNYIALFSDDENNYYINSYSSKNKTKNKEVKIYSLYENNTIEQAIGRYKRTYNDIDFKYEVGIEDSSISENDAIKKLNTELMSGNGPDIVLLDGLNEEQYISSGLLKDISSIINDSSNNEEYFSSILNCYKDGEKIYRIPLKFDMPVVIGKGVSSIHDINSLENYINKFSNASKSIGGWDSKELIYLLYPFYKNNIINDKNEINKENLTSFLKEIKYIKNKYTDTDMNTNELLNSCLKYKCDGIIFMLQDTDFDIGNIASITEYAYVNDISKSSKLEYSLLGTSNINYFIPETIVSVCSKSKNTEECSKFIKYLLSSEFEKINYESGFSINKTALMEEYNEMDSADPISGITTYKGNSIDIYKPSLDSINNLISNINLLEKIQYMFILNS